MDKEQIFSYGGFGTTSARSIDGDLYPGEAFRANLGRVRLGSKRLLGRKIK
jgi:hypothetical protein